MGILEIVLFLLGVGFLFLGWRWQNPPNEEALTALKGLAYLKREINRVQDQVHDLEGEILNSKLVAAQKVEHREVLVKGIKANEQESEQLESEDKSTRYQFEPYPRLSPKYQEVLELSANGQRVPEIAQDLFLSQDAVRMVLNMHPKGGVR